MAKKKLDKEAERTPSSPGKIAAILKLRMFTYLLR